MSDHTLLLLHGETLTDASNNHVPLTNNGVTVSSAQSKFGGKSLYFNGASNILYDSSKTHLDKLSSFTIDWWEFCENGAASRFSNSWNQWGSLLIGYLGTGIYAGSEFGAWSLIANANMISVTLGQWVHWAFVKDGNVAKLYRNGKLFASAGMSGNVWAGGGQATIGGYYTGSPDYFRGYIDEFRISDIARWTSDFTPPDKPYIITEPQKENAVVIGGTIYKIECGNAMINGTIHKVDSGNVLVAGTVRKIEFVKPIILHYEKTVETSYGNVNVFLNDSLIKPGDYEVNVGDRAQIYASSGRPTQWVNIYVNDQFVEGSDAGNFNYGFKVTGNCSIIAGIDRSFIMVQITL